MLALEFAKNVIKHIASSLGQHEFEKRCNGLTFLLVAHLLYYGDYAHDITLVDCEISFLV